MVKKYKRISDLDDHSDIHSSDSAEMNTENAHPDNRGSKADIVENVDSANNVRRLSRTRNLPIRFREAYTHRKKLMKVGDMWYIQWIWMYFVCVDFACGICIELCIYFGRGLLLVN